MALVETVLAAAFIFAFLSLIASSIKELIENFVQKRKKDMRGAILDLLGESGGRTLFQSQLMNVITSQDSATANPDLHKHWPSYLDANTFARTVSTMLHDVAFRRLWDDSPLGRAVAPLTASGQDLVSTIEMLFQQRMERVEGGFKRNAQVWLFAIGLVLAVALDADGLHLIARVRADVALRETVVAVATRSPTAELAGGLCPLGQGKDEQGSAAGTSQQNANAMEAPPASGAPLPAQGNAPGDSHDSPASESVSLQQISACVDQALPGVLGWTEARRQAMGGCGSTLLMAVLGYLLTAAAISLGAPFWFDVLGKVSNLRSTLKSPDQGKG